LKNNAFGIFSFTSIRDKRLSVAPIYNKYTDKKVIQLIEKTDFKLLKFGLTENIFFTNNKIESYYWVLVQKTKS